MKKYLGWAVLALILSLGGYYFSGIATAQAPGGPGFSPQMSSGPKIVLIDVNYIFKNHDRFKSMMNDMKNDVKQAEDTVNAEKTRVETLIKRRDEFSKGTNDYRVLDEDITRAKAEMAVKIQSQRNDFLQREAQIYHTVYQEILLATDYFCKQNGIDIVLRFNGDPVDPQRPDSVLQFINRPVVWYQPNVDITPVILKDLNRTPINPAAGNNRGGPMTSRPMVPFGANPLH